MSRDYTRIAKRYARDIVTGKLPACRQIIQAAERFERDLVEKKWVYNKAKAAWACGIIELLPHMKGEKAAAGEPIRLEPWQIFILANLFGFTDRHGKRRYREAFLLIPRKNGKSTLAAGIGAVMAFADGEHGAEVWVGANSEAQANHCFQPAKHMAGTPDFAEHFGVEVRAQSIVCEATNSFIQRMIGKPGDGSNPHCAILDEAHENDTPDQYDTMKTGMNARSQPLLLTITTAGFNTAGPCMSQQRYAEAVLAGDTVNERLFAMIYTIDREDDWRDFSCWKKANPNIGVSFSEESLKTTFDEALQRPEKAATAQTKHLNVWVSSRSAWLNMSDWGKAAQPELCFVSLKGKRAWLGLDLATKTDIAALVALVELDDGKLAYIPFLFLPESALARSKNAESYRVWKETGELIITSGEATDFGQIEEKVRELCEHLDVQAIGFDQWQAEDIAQRLQADRLNVIKCAANTKTFAPAMMDFEAELTNGKIVHPNNRAFNWMAANIVAKPDVRGNLYPRKPDGQDHLKIDGVVAALMAKAVSREAAPVAQSLEVMWLG